MSRKSVFRADFRLHPAFFYSLCSLLVFARCWGGGAYFDSDLLAQFGPWRAFLKDQLAQGHFPLWNPYLLGGQPFLADLQNMMLYPLNYLTLPFSVPWGLTIFLALHWILAAWGMHRWLGILGLSPSAQTMGALLFSLSGFFWIELIHPPVIAAFAWLPWWFGALESLRREPGSRRAFLAGVTFAMLFLSGSFQVSLGAFYAGAAYFAFRWFQSGPDPFKPKNRVLFVCSLLFFIAGSIPILSQLIPTMEFVNLTDRKENLGYEAFNAIYSLDPHTLYHWIFPTIDLPAHQFLDVALQNNEAFLSNEFYMGAWVPFLLILALCKPGKIPRWFFLGLGLFTLGLCLGRYFFLQEFLVKFLPGFSSLRAPFRFSFLWVFSLATLAAAGWESLQARLQKRPLPLSWIQVGWIYALFLLLAAALRPQRTLWEIAALLVFSGGLWMAVQKIKRPPAGLLLEAALILPLLFRGWEGFTPATPANFNFAANSKALLDLAQPVQPRRVLVDPRRIPYPIQVHHAKYAIFYPENIMAAFRLKDFGGYNPLTLSAVDDIRLLSFDKSFKLMAVQGLLTAQDLPTAPGFEKQTDTFLHFYKNLYPVPYLFAPLAWRIFPDAKALLTAMGQPAFDPYQQGFLSQALPGEIAAQISASPAGLQYAFLEDEPWLQTFQVTLKHAGLVVFSEVAYPGWKAWVDGAASPLYTADHALRALWMPAGSHRVDFRYQPWWFNWIGLPWLVCALAGLWIFRKKVSSGWPPFSRRSSQRSGKTRPFH